MSAFKQKIMAVAAFEIDTLDMLDVTCKAFPMSFHKRERKDAEFVYKRAFAAANLRLTSLLTRLVDEVEVLKAALAFYAKDENYHGPNQNAVEGEPSRPGGFRLDVTFDCGFFAREAIEAHQKRWEDLK